MTFGNTIPVEIVFTQFLEHHRRVLALEEEGADVEVQSFYFRKRSTKLIAEIIQIDKAYAVIIEYSEL
jgi:hypothetical protein